jgi:hypothetical protein
MYPPTSSKTLARIIDSSSRIGLWIWPFCEMSIAL